MSRIEGVQDQDAGFIVGRVFKSAGKMVGDVPEPLRLMAKSGGAFWANIGFELGLGRAKSVDDKLKTLASIKVASMVGCVF
jgi:hypothetical protein